MQGVDVFLVIQAAIISSGYVPFTFTIRVFSRCFYPKQLTISTFVRRKRKQQYIAVGVVETSGKHLQLLG